MKTVGIIGGSGFIGSYVTRKFLTEGFDVKVGVTDIKNPKKYRHLFDFAGGDNLAVDGLRVEEKVALADFVKNCSIVVHAGTPFKLDVKDPGKEIFSPTVQGTENFLEVLGGNEELEKVVFVASVAAWNTNFPLPAGSKGENDSFDETDDRFISEESHPYAQAKYMANGAVMKYIVEHPQCPFEITTVSPVAVLGKPLSNRDDSTSVGLQFLIKNKIAPDDFVRLLFDQDVAFAIVDVEDVAEAIFAAATTKGLHGKDFLLSSETYKISDMHAMLNGLAPVRNPAAVYGNALARKHLGVSFRPAIETLHTYSAPQKTPSK